jgi:ribonuclease Z
MKIPLVFLGTSPSIPTAKRNHTAVLLKYKSETILIDCGEGTQRQFRKIKLNPCKITRILITHWHGDHILGLPGLFQTLALSNYSKTLYIYGPKGTKRFINKIYKMFIFKNKLKLEVKEVHGKFFENQDFYLEAASLKHGARTNGYSFVEKNKIRLNRAKLKKLKLPNSPLLKKLQQGKNIKYKGKVIKAKDITYLEKGKKITFLWDTVLCNNCQKIAKDSDLLITESTYAEKDIKKYKHLTAKQAAKIAKKSKSKKLILTHLSQRYENNEKVILNEAKKTFKNTIIAEDLMKVEV